MNCVIDELCEIRVHSMKCVMRGANSASRFDCGLHCVDPDPEADSIPYIPGINKVYTWDIPHGIYIVYTYYNY